MNTINKINIYTHYKIQKIREMYWRRKLHKESLSMMTTVLCFHNVSAEIDSIYNIKADHLEKILDLIEDDIISIDEIGKKNGVVITFDDGYKSAYTIVYPMLKNRNMPFVVYISTDYIDRPNYLTSNEICLMAEDEDICEIGSHMCSHSKTREMSDSLIRLEWEKSRDILNKITHKEIRHCALPYGSVLSCSKKSIDIAFQMGYETVATTCAIPYKKGRIIPRFVYNNQDKFVI